ncbi:hypothetical protein AU361_12090 [Klebsiella pneumoniae]|nr:hypothetical protein AU361_12090 [Klebsiella pneumoniae]
MAWESPFFNHPVQCGAAHRTAFQYSLNFDQFHIIHVSTFLNKERERAINKIQNRGSVRGGWDVYWLVSYLFVGPTLYVHCRSDKRVVRMLKNECINGSSRDRKKADQPPETVR